MWTRRRQTISENAILSALRKIKLPASGEDIVSHGLISAITITGADASVILELPEANGDLQKSCEQTLKEIPGIGKVTVVATSHRGHPAVRLKDKGDQQVAPALSHTHRGGQMSEAGVKNKEAQWNCEPIPGVKKIIAVASGKGGVGKSTLAVNLAVAAASLGYKTGLLDADIYGPSIPRMMGLSGKPEAIEGKMVPLKYSLQNSQHMAASRPHAVLNSAHSDGQQAIAGAKNKQERFIENESAPVKCISMGFMIEGDDPIVWRGPMLSKALHQMARGTTWEELDILFVDMPPGTGDIHISMAQQVPLDGAIIVSTPQEVALMDARKCLNMFRKISIPVLGMVENMSYFIDPASGNKTFIFGEGGVKNACLAMEVPFLGEIPLDPSIRQSGDDGTPQVQEWALAICTALGFGD